MENLGKHLQGGLAFTENDVASHITDLYRPIAQEVSMTSSCVGYNRPISMNQHGPYQFAINERGNYYIQLNQIRLYLRAKVLLEDGGDIALTDGVGICNLFGNSLFQTIDFEIGGRLIPELQNTHLGYKSFLEKQLSYAPNGGTGPLAASLWIPDEAKHFEDFKYHAEDLKPFKEPNAENSQNDGFRVRRGIVGASKLFDMCLDLHSDFLSCDRLLPPGVSMLMSLTRQKDTFLLMHPTSAKTFKVVIEGMKLAVPYIALTESLVENHKRLGANQPVLLPIKKTDIIVHHAPKGALMTQLSDLFRNRVPNTLIIAMVETTAYYGSTSKNPYNFQHFNVNHATIAHNGVWIPSEPYTPDWTNKLFAREYRAFFDNTGIGTDNIPSAINPTLYANGCTLFAFDLTPDKCKLQLYVLGNIWEEQVFFSSR